jgi:hypothetical protein
VLDSPETAKAVCGPSSLSFLSRDYTTTCELGRGTGTALYHSILQAPEAFCADARNKVSGDQGKTRMPINTGKDEEF